MSIIGVQKNVFQSEEIKKCAVKNTKGGNESYWLQPSGYDRDEHENQWSKLN